MATFIHAFGSTSIDRFPHDQTLQGFDAADALLLADLHRTRSVAGARILVIGDRFGALAATLASTASVFSLGDSHNAQTALRANLEGNGLSAEAVTFVSDPRQLSSMSWDAVLIRPPKALALLRRQVSGLHLANEAYVAAGEMIKHLPHTVGDILQHFFGEVQASLAERKARLLRVPQPHQQTPLEAPQIATYALANGTKLDSMPGVFSADHLDVGTRALLECLPTDCADRQIADLGCGNGILAIASASANPAANYTLVDESYAATESAHRNWLSTFGDRPVRIECGHLLEPIADRTIDIVLCNPPFHTGHAVGGGLAWAMFVDARRVLRPGGELYLVGNRHLGYHTQLPKIFGSVRQIGGTNKFVVLKARTR
ncbi:MAG: methyltransferase [Antricoccus sp.]